MKPDIDNDPLVDALRADLPNAEQSARLRARLAALGIASAGVLATSSAIAAGAAAKTATDLGLAAGVLARFSALSLSAKVGVAGVVCGSLVAAPAAILSSADAPTPPVSVAAKPKQSGLPREAHGVALSHTVAPLAGSAPLPDLDGAAPQASPIVEPPTRERPPVATFRGGAVATGTGLRAHARPKPVTTAAADEKPRPVDTAQSAPSAAFDAVASVRPEAPMGAPAPGAEAPVAASPAGTTLTEETSLMDRAFSALRTGDRRLALELVREHERRFPEGLLRRERERARAVLARDTEH